MIGLCGCVAQQEGERRSRRVPRPRLRARPGGVGELRATCWPPARAGRAGGRHRLPRGAALRPRRHRRDGAYKGMVTVIEGCDKRCTFCIVPADPRAGAQPAAGRDPAEVRHLLDYGFVEIELLGPDRQPLAGAPGGEPRLRRPARRRGRAAGRAAAALRHLLSARLHAADGRAGRRATRTSAPTSTCRSSRARDRVLRRMGRGYTRDEYRELAGSPARARGPAWRSRPTSSSASPARPTRTSSARSTLIEEVRFAALFAFKYSPRPGTAALAARRRGGRRRVADDACRALRAAGRDPARAQRGAGGDGARRAGDRRGREPERADRADPCHRIVHFQPPPERTRARPSGRARLVRVRNRARARRTAWWGS